MGGKLSCTLSFEILLKESSSFVQKAPDELQTEQALYRDPRDRRRTRMAGNRGWCRALRLRLMCNAQPVNAYFPVRRRQVALVGVGLGIAAGLEVTIGLYRSAKHG